MTPEELKREDEFLEAQAKAIREHIAQKQTDVILRGVYRDAAEVMKVPEQAVFKLMEYPIDA